MNGAHTLARYGQQPGPYLTIPLARTDIGQDAGCSRQCWRLYLIFNGLLAKHLLLSVPSGQHGKVI